MPCYDPPHSAALKEALLNQGGGLSGDQAEAVLCAVLRAIESQGPLYDFLNHVDFAEAGVPRALVQRWWRKHKAQDESRKEQEPSI